MNARAMDQPDRRMGGIRPGLRVFVSGGAAGIGRSIADLLVAVERTGRYHHPPARAFAAGGFEVRTVHPFATKQFRLPADPGNKTDDTDLAAITRAAVNGFALVEPALDESWRQFFRIAEEFAASYVARPKHLMLPWLDEPEHVLSEIDLTPAERRRRCRPACLPNRRPTSRGWRRATSATSRPAR